MPRKGSPIGPRVTAVLPCLSCEHGAKAVEEVAAVFLDAMHGSQPPRTSDRPWRFLPKACCRQRQGVDPEALVA
jgi:hypothetical protein